MEVLGLARAYLEHEVVGELATVPFHGLVQGLRRDLINSGQVAVQDHSLVAERVNEPCNVVRRDDFSPG